MGTLYITEYARAGRDSLQNVLPCGEEPGATMVVGISARSTPSFQLGSATKFVRLMADEPCHVQFGEEPTADQICMMLAPFHPEVFGVIPGMRIAVVAAD